MLSNPSSVESDPRSELVFRAARFGRLYFGKRITLERGSNLEPSRYTQRSHSCGQILNSIIRNWIKTSTIAVWICEKKKPVFSGKVGQVRFERRTMHLETLKSLTTSLGKRQKGAFALICPLSVRLNAVSSLFVYAGSPRGRIKAERYRRG